MHLPFRSRLATALLLVVFLFTFAAPPMVASAQGNQPSFLDNLFYKIGEWVDRVGDVFSFGAPPSDSLTAQSAGYSGRVFQVGPTRQYTKPSDVMPLLGPGDTVEIDAATYTNDVFCLDRHGHNNNGNPPDDVLIKGVGGRPIISGIQGETLPSAEAQHGQNYRWCSGKGIWVIQADGVAIDNIEFRYARVNDGNGAGIRLEGPNLHVMNSYFHHNQNGILATAPQLNDNHTRIENTEFAFNGGRDGLNHNLYVNRIEELTFKNNYSHDARQGHLLKTRAQNNYVIANRLTTENGTDSYQLEISGGRAYVIGNMIQKGPNSENSSTSFHFYTNRDGDRNQPHELYFVNNTYVDNKGGNWGFIRLYNPDGYPLTAYIANNIFVTGTRDIVRGSGDVTMVANRKITHTEAQNEFVDISGFDYHLTADSLAINGGVEAGSANNISLTPTEEYVHPRSSVERTISGPAIDMGAYEFYGTPTNEFPPPTLQFSSEYSLTDSSSDLTWSSNADTCEASGAWSGTKPTSGTFNTGPIFDVTTYTLTCTGPGGDVSETLNVTPPDDATITFGHWPNTVPSGTGAILYWTNSNTVSCEASGGPWSGSQAVNGEHQTGPITANQTYTLACTGLKGEVVTRSHTVTVGSAVSELSGLSNTFHLKMDPEELSNGLVDESIITSTVGPGGRFEDRGQGEAGFETGFDGQGVWFGTGNAGIQQAQDTAYYEITFSDTQARTIFNEDGGEISAYIIARWPYFDRNDFIPSGSNNHRYQTIFNAPGSMLQFEKWGDRYNWYYRAPGSDTKSTFTSGSNPRLGNALGKELFNEGKILRVRLVWDGSQQRLYLNDILLHRQAYTKRTLNWNTSNKMIVGASLGGDFLDGFWVWRDLLDEFRIHNAGGGGETDTTAPSVSVTAPSEGATVSGVTTLSASASDDVAVSSVEFLASNQLLGSDSSAPYTHAWDTAGFSNGTYSIQARARDTSGNSTLSDGVSVTVQNDEPEEPTDTTAPSATITSPLVGSTVSGTISISAQATDDVAVKDVQFLVDNQAIGTDSTSPYTHSWDTTTVTNGTHTLQVLATDTSGNSALSDAITVTVDNTVTTEPGEGYRYVQWVVTKKRTAGTQSNCDDGCIQASEFELMNGTSPVAWPQGTTAENPGGRNPAGEEPGKAIDDSLSTKWLDWNFGTTDPSDPQVGSARLDIDVGSGNTVAFDRYRYATGNDFSERDPVSWELYGSTDGSTWTLLDKRTDASVPTARNTYTGTFSVDTTTTPPEEEEPDTTPPTVAITSPDSGAVVSGTINVDASASDDVGIGGVTFLLDGTAVGSEDSSAPYSISIDTNELSNGSHTLQARARDTSNNTALSPIVSVTVENLDSGGGDSTTDPVIIGLGEKDLGGSFDDIRWEISWQTNVPTDARIEWGLSQNNLSRTPVTSSALTTSHALALTNLSRKTFYYYQVTSVDSNGNSVTSDVESFRTGGRPSKVDNLTAKNGSVVLEWDVPNDPIIESIKVYRVEGRGGTVDPNSSSKRIAVLDADAERYRDNNVEDNQRYTYLVYTYDSDDSPSLPATIEFTAQTTSGGGGGGGGGGGSSSRGSSGGVSNERGSSAVDQIRNRQVLLLSLLRDLQGLFTVLRDAEESTVEQPGVAPQSSDASQQRGGIFNRSIEPGEQSSAVQLLQRYLGTDPTLYPEGIANGTYGPLTQRAVERFQERHGIVSGGTPGTTGFGRVGPSTVEKLNEVFQNVAPIPPQSAAPANVRPTDTGESTPSAAGSGGGVLFTRVLQVGDEGEDVRELQRLLSRDEKVYPQGNVTGFFTPLTQIAVQKFQCKYNVVCGGSPGTSGYGLVGPGTQAALEQHLGQ